VTGTELRAWVPAVPGIAEVFHARFTDHAYPAHAHDTWTLLVVDQGVIRYDLHRHEHGALRTAVTLLPPHVSHTGRSATADGFRKRVLYLDTDVLDVDLTGAAVAAPSLDDGLLRTRVDQLHRALVEQGRDGFGRDRSGDDNPGSGNPGSGNPGSGADPDAGWALEAESRLALIGDRIRMHLRAAPGERPVRGPQLAGDLRELLDERLVPGITLHAAAEILHAHPAHLVRSFTAAFGLPPHRYLTGRRVEAARRRLLDGEPIAAVATAVGFHDQAHLHRHFTRLVGTTPLRFARP
jgi:AraC-like DNA-binding protein